MAHEPISGNCTLGGGLTTSVGGKSKTVKGISIHLEGATPEEIAAAVNRLGSLPQSVIRTPVSKTATKVKRLARMLAPKRSGDLRHGIVVRPGYERTKNKARIVKDIWMDPRMTDTFVKMSREGVRYYYPSSMEYGFRLRTGGIEPGLYYMRTAGEHFEEIYEQMILDEMKQKAVKLWLKKQS